MLVTPLGISTDVRAVPAKALLPILVTEFGIIADVRLEQLLKASAPILVTPLGISIDVRAVPKNAQSPIDKSAVLNVTDDNVVQL